MEEEDVISDPVEIFSQIDEVYPSGGEEENPPKNPSETEAFLIVLVLGVVPDVIDFFSIGALSFLSSALSWPLTEYYFYQKNLQVPNVKKWFRWLNLGDVIPFLGAIPLKTTGLIIAVYIAWHPESKLARGAQTLEAATSVKGATKQTAKSSFRQKIKDVAERALGRPGQTEDGGDQFEMAYKKDGEDKDVYGEVSQGGQQILGPEEQADRAAFGEVISAPPEEQEEEEATSLPEPRVSIQSKPKLPTEIAGEPPTSMSSKEKERQEEIESRLGIGEIERSIKEKLSSPEAVMEDGQVLASDNENVVDLSNYRKNKKNNSSESFLGEGDNSREIAA